MKGLELFPNIFLYAGVVDFRKQAQALALVVQHTMGRSPIEAETLFVFVARDKRKLRLLYWDTTGFALWSKILESDRFFVPKPIGNTITLRHQELSLLLKGYDVFRMKPHKEISYERYS